jgi:signal transduction histidine kinase
MSHELRTPLNAIRGYAELLEMGLRGPVTDAQREDLRRIRRSERHLLGLINQILNFARIETGNIDFHPGLHRLDAVLADVQAFIAPQVSAKGLAYEYVPGEPSLAVWCDADKLRQILLNLLSNALKFTEPGGRVTLCCAAEGEMTVVRVADTGCGIPPDKLEAVFAPFVQLGRSLSSRVEGTGLGLAIGRDLARRMGGDLTVQSEVGAGSTFTLALPRSAVAVAGPCTGVR